MKLKEFTAVALTAAAILSAQGVHAMGNQASQQSHPGFQGPTASMQIQTDFGALNPLVNQALAARTSGAYAQAIGDGASAAPGSQADMLAEQTAVFGRMGLSATADAAAGAGPSAEVGANLLAKLQTRRAEAAIAAPATVTGPAP